MSSLERFSCRENSQFGSPRAGREGVAALCASVSGHRAEIGHLSLVLQLLSSVQSLCLTCRGFSLLQLSGTTKDVQCWGSVSDIFSNLNESVIRLLVSQWPVYLGICC